MPCQHLLLHGSLVMKWGLTGTFSPELSTPQWIWTKQDFFTVSQNGSTNFRQGCFILRFLRLNLEPCPGQEGTLYHNCMPSLWADIPLLVSSLTTAIMCEDYAQWPWLDNNYSS